MGDIPASYVIVYQRAHSWSFIVRPWKHAFPKGKSSSNHHFSEANGAGKESVDEPAEEEWQEASPAIFIATVSFNLPGKHREVAVV